VRQRLFSFLAPLSLLLFAWACVAWLVGTVLIVSPNLAGDWQLIVANPHSGSAAYKAGDGGGSYVARYVGSSRGALVFGTFSEGWEKGAEVDFAADPRGGLRIDRRGFSYVGPQLPPPRELLGFGYAVGKVASSGHWCSERELRFPLWAVALVTAPLSGAILRRVYLHVRATRRRARGLCPSCGYDLRASPERCPECGKASVG
jgi:hypothetical protein